MVESPLIARIAAPVHDRCSALFVGGPLDGKKGDAPPADRVWPDGLAISVGHQVFRNVTYYHSHGGLVHCYEWFSPNGWWIYQCKRTHRPMNG